MDHARWLLMSNVILQAAALFNASPKLASATPRVHVPMRHASYLLTAAPCLHLWPCADWPPEELLSGPALLQQYDPAALRAFVGRLTPANMLAVLTSKRAKGVTTHKERWWVCGWDGGACAARAVHASSPYAGLLWAIGSLQEQQH